MKEQDNKKLGISQGRLRHGMSGTKTYRVWHAMIERCTKTYCKDYKAYGGRGITFEKKWATFEGFFEDMGEQPPGLELDRTDNNGNYCKENCRWITHKENCNNRRKRKDYERNIEKICRQCGKKYLAKVKDSQYCSLRCNSTALRRKRGIGLVLQRICENCGKDYSTTSPKSKCCSKSCRGKISDKAKLLRRREAMDGKLKGVKRVESGKFPGVCKFCGKPFETYFLKTRFCSRECKIKHRCEMEKQIRRTSAERWTRECKVCGKVFEAVNKRRIYCSRQCKGRKKS